MKKYFFGIFLGLFFILSFKLDSFASSFEGTQTFYIRVRYNVGSDNEHVRSYNFNVPATYVNNGVSTPIRIAAYGDYMPDSALYLHLASNVSLGVNQVEYNSINLTTGQVYPAKTFAIGSGPVNGAYISGALFDSSNEFVSANIPVYSTLANAYDYLDSGDTTGALNQNDLGFSSSEPSNNIPTPIVNWALNNDGTVSRTLQFTNAQLPQNPNIRMGLQLIVHWASVDNITISYANQSANFLGTGYSVFYDNALSQDGVDLGYPLPSKSSDMKPCPSEINFLTNTDSISLFNSFLVSHPVNSRTINYSPSSISTFVDSFRTHLGSINFEYNVPYVSCRYYYTTSDGTGLIFGGWTNTYPKLPSQGAVLSINKQNGQITVPINDGTFNQGTDINGNTIFDNGTTIESPELVNFDDLNNSVQNMFSYLGQFPSFLAYLFPFLPSWVPILMGSIIGTLLVIGLIRILLK